jgi:hypothetical protein
MRKSGQLFPNERRSDFIASVHRRDGGYSRVRSELFGCLDESGTGGAIFYAFTDRLIDFIDGQ